ncbi:MAG: SDR family NAD(P)-dependent oxidoreductase [Acidimicrobiia bacterium]
MSNDRITGRTALVTGAASGIGRACARRFHQEGARVIGLDLAAGDDPAVERWLVADVADEAAVAGAVQAAHETLGNFDILVNAAGVGGAATAGDLDEAEWDRIVGVNLKGTWLVSKHVVNHMVRDVRGGSIVNLASIEGVEAFQGQTAYNVSKAGVILLTKNMAVDYGHLGIRVNCLCPGLVETPMTAMLHEDWLRKVYDRFVEQHMMLRSGQPEEVAAAALFLASDDASFVTGHALVVDGGFTAGRRLVAPGEDLG